MKLRLRNAEKVFELVQDYEAMERLKAKAWRDYWDEVPDFGLLKRQAKIESS